MTNCKTCKQRIRGEAIVRVADVDAMKPFAEFHHPACFPLPPGWRLVYESPKPTAEAQAEAEMMAASERRTD